MKPSSKTKISYNSSHSNWSLKWFPAVCQTYTAKGVKCVHRIEAKNKGQYNSKTAMHRVRVYLNHRIYYSLYHSLCTLGRTWLTKRVTLSFVGQLSGDVALYFSFRQCCLLSQASIAVAECGVIYYGCECLGMYSWRIWFDPRPEYQTLSWFYSDRETRNRLYIPTVRNSSPINTSLFTVHNYIPI